MEASFSRVLSQLRSRIPAHFPEHRQLPRYLGLASWVGSECLRPPEPQDAFPTWPGLWGACTPGGLCAVGPPQRSSWPSDAEAQAAGRDPEDLGVPVSACQAVLEALPRSGGARSAGPRLPLSVNLVKCKSHTAVFFTAGGGGKRPSFSCAHTVDLSSCSPQAWRTSWAQARSQVAQEWRWVGAWALNLVCLSPKPGQRRFPRASCLPS